MEGHEGATMISVVLATYNGEHYIKEQVSSILSQLTKEDEVIISDDHSTDLTKDIILSFQDPRILFVSNDYKKRGYSGNFETALKLVRGSIIFMSDQDDVWLPNKVSLMINTLNHCDLVVSDAIITDKDLNPIFLSHFKNANVKTGFFRNFAKTRYIGACMAFRKNVLDKALPFPKHLSLCPHDYWITLISEALFKVELLPTPLIYYRRHDKNASSGGVSKSTDTLALQLLRRSYCAVQLGLRMFRSK